MANDRPVCLLLCALGGEGGGVLSNWLIETARRAGYLAQKTSIPGVAQRTGATTYYVEIYPVPIEQLGGRKPVFSLYPVPGMVDALISSELLETARQVALGMADALNTVIVSSTSRSLTTNERIPMGDGRFDSTRLVEVLRANSRALHLVDMGGIARDTGTAVSAAMLGAVAASGLLPFALHDFEAAIAEGGKSARVNLEGFTRAYLEVAQARGATATAPPAHGFASQTSRRLPEAVRASFPAAAQDMLALGYARLLDYQDVAYADLYVRRMQRVLDGERASDPEAAHDYATTREMARWLALWMAFDDVIRVADLKLRGSRRLRVRKEVRAGEGDIVKIYDYFRPGVAELAGLLPAPLAHLVLRWDDARRQRGMTSASLPLVLATHTAMGTLILRALAALRRYRPRSHRYAREQALIEHWMQAVQTLQQQDWRCGYEMALCARLIKGYGATNEHGKGNLQHLLENFVQIANPAAPAFHAQAIARAREAALADDAGKTFDTVLQSYGAPARPRKAVPIRFVKRARAPTL